MTCTYIGDGKFRVVGTKYEVIVVLSCEVEDVIKGDVHVPGRGEFSFDEVNDAAMRMITEQMDGALVAPKKRRTR